ncbi:hypothetical protein CFC21_018137 [Triticum aestivum]|nr:psbQ-like protein 3, chloroplastic [Triticum aestivum]KAF7002692.1 hypothetical protein CFC21_018137 [Triticum aestivum]VAH34466.1 unnamed protein product [Triticum turgidum subsp. durum]
MATMLCVPEPMENRTRFHQRWKGSAMAMALQLAIQSLAASLFRSPNKPATKPPSNGHRHPQEPTGSSRCSGRRSLAAAAAAAAVGTALLASQLLPPTAGIAGAFDLDLRITIPEQSSEEAEAVVRTHARNLVRVKQFIDARSWRELQTALRASAANLKQDLYAIIQARPPGQRPELRRLYSDLFNNVTRLDYAARDKDEPQVQECYGNIVAAIDQIFARIM